MAERLETTAEELAKRALELPAFRSVALLKTKDAVADALALIGREHIFAEYTRHDISHVNGMLSLLDEIIPETAREEMSPADWLLIVLSVYFHDLGLLVTRGEFERRDLNEVQAFAQTELFAGEDGRDARSKVEALGEDEGARFVYQEFVRARHAERIRSWITGDEKPYLGPAEEAANLVSGLVADFPLAFREDLALVCESHHRSDLGDTSKYQVSRPYGTTTDETANVQYAALILRTADLLHIVNRAPSIMYRLIAPTDPVSQEEWLKQGAVTAVRSQLGTDDDGNVRAELPRSAFEVYADFPDESGFFGLTSYVRYADVQIKQTFDWAETARLKQGAKHVFPWQRVDDEHIRAKDYLRESFEFTLDQAKVLDLLTGHTLYNDSSVVLRELIQNSLDAIRVQYLNGDVASSGRIEVAFDSASRLLSVRDNGTGMTQGIIRKHLLKVGSSRYSDEEFRKEHPDFSPISRFGIGVLSCFMIADSVQVTTCHPDEEEAPRLTLRDVQGRYLMQLLDKRSDVRAASVAPHGTLMELRLRPSAELEDVVEIVKRWVVVPGCTVEVKVDDEDPVLVGHATIGEALTAALAQRGQLVDGSRVRVEEFSAGGIHLAVAARWSDYFREWQLIDLGATLREERPVYLGTCVEGIRVETTTPGYRDQTFFAMANATGASAPRTNVARSTLEPTSEREQTLRNIYGLYCQHVEREIHQLIEDRGFSVTWAAREGTYLTRPLRSGSAVDLKLLRELGSDLPLLVMDTDGARRLTSANQLAGLDAFWTVDAAFFSSVEALLTEVPGGGSLPALEAAFGEGSFELPDGPVLSGSPPDIEFTIAAILGKDVTRLRILRERRRADLYWSKVDEPVWWDVGDQVGRMNYRLYDVINSPRRYGGAGKPVSISLDNSDVDVDGPETYIGLRAFERLYLFGDAAIVEYARDLRKQLIETPDDGFTELMLYAVLSAHPFRSTQRVDALLERVFSRVTSEVGRSPADAFAPYGGIEGLRNALEGTDGEVFDPKAWVRDEA